MNEKSEIDPQIARYEFYLGQDYFYGLGGRRRNRARALRHLLVAAAAGYRHAQNLVGYCIDHGLGTKRNPRKALYWYFAAAKQGHPVAIFNIALTFDQGAGVRRDWPLAFRYYKIAAGLAR